VDARFIRVVDSPFFAVTASDGTFSIAGMPPGHHLLHAWHTRRSAKSPSGHVPAEDRRTLDIAW